MEGEDRVPPKPRPHDKEVVRRVEKARPGAKTTESTFDAIIDAILNADPEAVREHLKGKSPKIATATTPKGRGQGSRS